MHVAVDGVGNFVGGGWSVLRRTVGHLANDERVSRVSVFCSPLDLVVSDVPGHPKIQWLQHPGAHWLPLRLDWWRRGLNTAMRHVSADVLLTMNGVGTTARPSVALVQQAFMVWGRLRRVRPRLFATKLAVLRRELAKALPTAGAVVVQTPWMRDQVQRKSGRRAEVIPLGLPEPIHDEAERDLGRVVVFRRDLPYKRYEVVRRAVEIATKHRALRLHTIDDTHPDEVPGLLAQAGTLAVASDVESFGLPVVEAFAAGCPVLLTDHPWAHAVAGDAALYFDHGDPGAAANRLLEIANSPDLAADLGDRGRLRLAALWEATPYTRLVDLLESVA